MEEAHIPEITRTSQAIRATLVPVSTLLRELHDKCNAAATDTRTTTQHYVVVSGKIRDVMAREDIADLSRSPQWHQFQSVLNRTAVQLVLVHEEAASLYEQFIDLFEHARDIYVVAEACSFSAIKHEVVPVLVEEVVARAIKSIQEKVAPAIDRAIKRKDEVLGVMREEGNKLQKAYDDIVPFLPPVQ